MIWAEHRCVAISLDNVEFNTLPSGVHTIDKDIMYVLFWLQFAVTDVWIAILPRTTTKE